MDYHEAANIFPLMTGKTFEEFKAAIAGDGLRHSIVTLDGKILDGRNRYRACLETDVEPRFEKYTGDQDPVDFVFTENADRRHLTTSQWAMVGARRRPFDEAKAKERKEEGRKKGGKTGGRGRPKIASSSKDDQAMPPRVAGDPGLASECAGKKVGVSPVSIDCARAVLDSGCDELIKAVDSGAVSVSAAGTVARHRSGATLAEIVKEGPKAIVAESAKLKKTKRGPKKNRKATELVDAIKKDIDRLVAFVKGTEKGLASQRETAVVNLRLAKKYVSATSDFFM